MACRLIMSYFLGFEKTRWFWGTSILDIDCLVENGPWKTAVAIFKHAIDFPNWKQNSKHVPATLAKFKIQLLYHLESRWRNSHVLVHHCPLLSHLSCTIHFHYSVSVFQAEWQSSKTVEFTKWNDNLGWLTRTARMIWSCHGSLSYLQTTSASSKGQKKTPASLRSRRIASPHKPMM